ncbi:MAG: YlmC/YmxH family sporulation protein [Clostridia bacterium]|nr:YlmC/YmxH family sporulation protein [Clostridia bacterium]
MKLTYKELKEREVINVVDGKSLGKIVDLTLCFPEGKLVGITVPGRNLNCFAKLFDRSTQYIDVKQILKIGGDVILVKITGGETVYTNCKKGKPEGIKPCPPPCGDNRFSVEGEYLEESDYDNDY